MAPIIKTSLAVLGLSGAAVTLVAAHQQNVGMLGGRHLKLVQRDEAAKREFAPYGYDRCGVPRTSPYVRKAGASPSASANWKPCANALSPSEKAKANPAVPTEEDQKQEEEEEEEEQDDDSDNTDEKGEKQWPADGEKKLAAGETGKDNSHDNDAPVTATSSSKPWEAPASDTWARDQFNGATVPGVKAAVASPASSSQKWSSTAWTTSYVDVTQTSTWTPENKPTPQAQAPAAAPSKDEESKPEQQQPAAEAPWSAPGHALKPQESSKQEEPKPAPSPETPAPKPAHVNTGGGPKLGLAWDWQNPKGKLQDWSGAGAIYTWSAYPPSDPLPAGMVWYPQYWGPGKEADINSQIASGAIHPGMTILGYNEPDQAGQANLGVWDAIGSFKRQLTPLASQGYTITSPATTSDEKGFQWIKEFMDNCGDCGISILQTHYYGTNADDFISYIQRLRQFNLPILISEYASETFGWGADLSLGETQAYVAKTQNWLKQQNDIVAYFYFGPVTPQAANGVNHNSLMIDGGGNMNDLGRQYLYNGH